MSDDTRVPNVGTTAPFEPFTVDAPAPVAGASYLRPVDEPKPPDPSLWKRGICTSYPGSPYGCGCAKCHGEMIESLDKELGTAPAPGTTNASVGNVSHTDYAGNLVGDNGKCGKAECWCRDDAPAPAGGEVDEQKKAELKELWDSMIVGTITMSCYYEKVAALLRRYEIADAIAAAEARVRAEERGKILDTTDSGAVGSCMNCGKPDSTEEIVTPFIAAERERVWRLAKDCLSENDNWNMPVLIGAALADGVDLTSLAKPE